MVDPGGVEEEVGKPSSSGLTATSPKGGQILYPCLPQAGLASGGGGQSFCILSPSGEEDYILNIVFSPLPPVSLAGEGGDEVDGCGQNSQFTIIHSHAIIKQ